MSDAVCVIPNCGKRAAADAAFCADHKDKPQAIAAICETLEQYARFDDEDKRSGEPEDRAYHMGRAAGLRMAIGFLK